MEDEEELKNQCFGGEFMGETYDHVMKRMQYRRQKRWWNAYLLFYEREDMPFTVVGTDGTPSPNLPGAIERAVQRENLEYSHTKAQFSSEYFKFMQALAQANMPSITDRRPEISELQEQLVMLTVKLLTKFLFSVGFHTKKMIRGSALEWSTILLTLLRCSKNVRFWFVTKALFEHPERFSEYLLECPSQEVRSAFSKLIAFLAHYSLDDGPYNRPFSLPSYEVATAPQMIETQIPSVDLHTLSDYLLDAALSLLKKEVGEHDRHLQQYFQLFLTYANQGISEQTQLLRMRLPSLFISLSVGEGPISLGYRHNSTDFTKLHSVVSLLIRCCDISERSRTMYQGMEPMENPFCEMPNPVAMHPDLDHAVFGSHKYIKKLIQENAGSEDTVRLVRFCCWENPIFSRMVLTELLFQLSYVYSYELKPYLDFLLHILLIEDSWQNPRILNTIRGFRDEQGADGLVDVIQRGRSHYQKRAYQCIKMMVVLFTSCQVANDFLHKDHILKRQWHDAVVWLAEELERRPYGHSYGYNNWSPPAQSNETSNGYFLERSNSAKQTLSRAYELCPVEEQPEEPETLMDESPQDRDSPISQPNNQYNSDTVHDSPDSQRRRPKSPVSPTQVRVTQTGPNTRIELRKANKTKSVDNLDQIEDFPSNQNVQESVPLQYMEED
jgi:ubiquitin carboxyl-terminal hydrolase 9/24